MIKRIMALFLALIMCLDVSITANAAVLNKPTEHIANVVYFVDFKDSNSNFMDGKVDKVKDMFDGNKDTSLSNYIKIISYNQMNVHNYFPQEQNGKITPYRLPNNRSYYNNSNETELISNVLENVPVDPSYNIDMNNDGYVDNVIFIFGAKKGEDGDVLWAHKANHNGATEVNGKKVNNYNIHNSYGLIDSVLRERGVLIHEFMHSIGYPDLYRSRGTGAPVGGWDIMASVSSFVQYPLSYLRSAISGWISIDTITQNGTYTLKPSSNSGDNQALILKTPISEKEFFVVEYRKAGTPYKDQLDEKIPGSGLIIYRVNTEETSNYHGNKDYIYVFRPGETGEGDGNGKLSEAFLSKESGRTTYGSSDFSKKISDKAITYSNGQNSGIVIENVSNAGEEITFDVKFTDTSNLDIWDVVGNKEVSNRTNNDIDMDVVGDKVYTVYNEDNKLKAKMFDGSNWVSLGDSIINNKGNNPTITVYNDTPYVLYHDSAYKSIVAKFTNNKWETVQTLTSDLSQYSDMIATNNGVYIAITNGKTTFMNEGKAYLKVFKLNSNTNKFECIGNNIHTGYVVEPSLSESNGNVYVSYTDFLQNNKVFIQKYENNTWKNIEGINLSASRAVIEVTDKKLYLATTFVNGTNSSQVHVYENNKWTKLGEDVGGSEVTNLLIDVNGKIPYVAYVDSVKGCSIVKKINGDKWVQEGLNVSDENLSKLDFKISNNKAYVAINPTASKKLLIKSRQLEKLNTGQIVGVSGITLNKTALNLTIGASESLVATISPSNATNKDVEWTSSNTNVATVDTTGKVTGVSAGSATITVKTKDGAKVATCNVTVKNPVISANENKLIGEDRYKTAIKVSNRGWSKSDNVVIVNSSAIVDALSATPFAKMKNAPILLTGAENLNNETKKEITRLGAKNVYVIGGTGVVSKNVVSELKAMNLNVDRISGDTRYTTALEVAKRLGNVSEIAVVNGVTGLADAVSIAPVAADRNMPIVLSSPNEGTKVFDEFIKVNSIKTSYVIGGEAAISKDVAFKLPNANRLGGASRNETNAIILEKFYTNRDLNNIFVAKDGMKKVDDLIDALAVGVLASKEKSPVVIVGNKLDAKQEELLEYKNPKEITQVGGNGNENAFSQIVNIFKK
nr:cell wall-binding repeat-containing protein [uncultured Romboutsia sp.]